MTRKQALHSVIEILTDDDLKTKIAEILDDLPFTGWSEETIFDTLDQFVIDHGRNPTTTDFKKKGLPPHPVIKLRFGVTLKEFLAKHYPTVRHVNSQIYYNKPKEEWRTLFINQYHKQKPVSSVEYDKNRPQNTPSWYTVSRMFGITGWYAWLLFCDITPYVNTREPPRCLTKKPALHVRSTFTLTDENGCLCSVVEADSATFHTD